MKVPRLTASTPWTGVQDPDIHWRPSIAGADVEFTETFQSGGQAVTLFVSLFANQRPGAEAVSSRTDFAGSAIWATSSLGRSRIKLDGRTMYVTRLALLAPRRTRIVWYWYWIGGRFTANPYLAKLLELKAKLLGGSQTVAVIAASLEHENELVPPETHLQNFLDHLSPLGAALEAVVSREVREARHDHSSFARVARAGDG